MRNSNNADFFDCRMAVHDIFNFGWVNVFTPRNDHVFEAVKHVHIAFRILIGGVPCSQPPPPA
jgi:hypothetical protein